MDDPKMMKAKADAWRECVSWFAYWPQMMFGPTHRVTQLVLDAIESANPYEADPTKLQPDLDLYQVQQAMMRARDQMSWDATADRDGSQAYADRLILARWITSMSKQLRALSVRASEPAVQSD